MGVALGLRRGEQVRQRIARREPCPTRVDVVDQVVRLGRRVRGRAQVDGRRLGSEAPTYIVHHHVERAKVRRDTVDGVLDGTCITHIELQRKRLGARVVALGDLVQLVDDRMNGARQRLVRLGALGRDGDVRAARDQRLGDFRADPPRGARAV